MSIRSIEQQRLWITFTKCILILNEVAITKSADGELKIYYDLTKTNFKELHRSHKISYQLHMDIEISKHTLHKWSIIHIRDKLNYCRLCYLKNSF